MDSDHDILEALDQQERSRAVPTTLLVSITALVAAVVCFFTLRLQMGAARELALDSAGLVAAVTAGGLLLAQRMIR